MVFFTLSPNNIQFIGLVHSWVNHWVEFRWSNGSLNSAYTNNPYVKVVCPD